MRVENPIALRFILQDELYLLNADKMPADTKPLLPPVTTVIPEPIITTPVADFNYLGKNLKHFLILVHYPDIDFIKDVHLTALENILKRKDLGIDDIVILNIASYPDLNFNDLLAFFKPGRLLVLGKNALPNEISTLKLNVPQTLNTWTGLYSFSFDEMMDNTEYKKAFWEQMKLL